MAKSEKQQRMEEIFAANPTIGRTKLAVMAGVNPTTARLFINCKRMEAAQNREVTPDTPGVSDTSYLARLEIENRHLKGQLKDKEDRLQELSAAADILKDLSEAQLTPPPWLEKQGSSKTYRAIATATIADTHFDEVVNPNELGGVNAYNRQIAQVRLREFFGNTVKLGRDFFSGIRMEGLVMPMLGDIVSGNIHDELAQSNAAAILDTCLFWSEEIASGIDHAAKHYGQVFCPCVVGNHGRQTKKPRAKGRVKDNFDYLIYSLIARHFKDDERITFKIPETADAHYNIYNVRYCITHGDQFRGGSGISGALSPLLLGDARKRKRSDATNRPYDYMVMGHWHQEIDTHGIIVSNSMKGYDEYAMLSNFAYSEPSQAFWLTDPDKGRTLRTSVHVRSKDEQWERVENQQAPAWATKL